MKKTEFTLKQKTRVIKLINKGVIFNGDKGKKLFPTEDGLFPKRDLLMNVRNNLFSPITEEVIGYFQKNNIDFWNLSDKGVEEKDMPTGHTLSSQIACVNHLFLLRSDKKAVLSIARNICLDIEDVFISKNDAYLPGYITFEFTSKHDYMSETYGKDLLRGSMNTSIDALIYGKRKNGSKILIPIEWKYTEAYKNKDKSTEKSKGATRLRRYSKLIDNSAQLKQKENNYKSSIYFFEPFYQLMRQTLMVELMIANKEKEIVEADDFIHIHVIPSENKDLLHNTYPVSNADMEKSWRSCLFDQNKYQIITPEKLLSGIDKNKYKDLIDYLSKRYW